MTHHLLYHLPYVNELQFSITTMYVLIKILNFELKIADVFSCFFSKNFILSRNLSYNRKLALFTCINLFLLINRKITCRLTYIACDSAV